MRFNNPSQISFLTIVYGVIRKIASKRMHVLLKHFEIDTCPAPDIQEIAFSVVDDVVIFENGFYDFSSPHVPPELFLEFKMFSVDFFFQFIFCLLASLT